MTKQKFVSSRRTGPSACYCKKDLKFLKSRFKNIVVIDFRVRGINLCIAEESDSKKPI